jgi:putative FmdB family regulatory protein
MPFYDLRCKNCGKEFNIMAKMSEREQKLIKCPECESNELDPIFSSVNIIQSRKSADMPACPNAHICGSHCGHK